ncbi:MltA domain-containing protein [Sphingomonas sp. BN140010]|uniref:peptidoglycan lytic exotransglycosylase n=1 Tax=Sphingomonas arvum TaxID=2992113 RepID=A0ABT3JDZ3_9SPHN|nr:MltA domain-containing protein [Sphingomonas sp. BN140010]MCW3797286.1 MltA domain-containing protein [Sphingomonas sp. BN140010]
MSHSYRLLAVTSAALLSAACATRPAAPPITGPTPPAVVPKPVSPKPANALAAGVTLASPRTLTVEQAERALPAFRLSCPALMRRTDPSGLTRGTDWQPLCAEAAAVQPGSAKNFFETRFEWARVGTDAAFATGYYEPEILGSRTPAPGFAVPIHRTPSDLVRCTRADGQTGRGRIDETGTCVLYYTRADIEDGALANKGLELAYAADPIDLFFVEIQGSGRLKLPDGSVMRLGYDGQNGRDYIAIGKLLRERGVLPPGGANMESIKAWMRAQPDGGRSLMRENPSYIFFKELTGPGPLGALNVAVTPRTTVAADPAFTPLGAPVWLDVDRPEADGLWVAQDTGGAIKGANRFDTFWGAGDYAQVTAGGMAAKGDALLLLPRGTVERARAAQAAATLAANAQAQP